MIEIDPNTIVTERFLESFKELHLKKQPNLNELVISVQNYCEQLNSGRVKYLRDKILLISENIDSKSLDLEQKKLLSYIKTFLDSYSQIVKESDSDILDEILNPEFEELSKAEDPIKLDLTQAEILGIIEGIFQVFSKEKISSTKLFKFCSNNFNSIRSKSDVQPFESYKDCYYNKLNFIGNKTGKHKYRDEKEKIIQKLEMIISHINTN